MSYKKHIFADGHILKAEHLNAMEDQIAQNESNNGNLADLSTDSKSSTVSAINELNSKKANAPTKAAVGQILVVKSVDSEGHPTEFETIALPQCDFGEEAKILLVDILGSAKFESDQTSNISALAEALGVVFSPELPEENGVEKVDETLVITDNVDAVQDGNTLVIS